MAPVIWGEEATAANVHQRSPVPTVPFEPDHGVTVAPPCPVLGLFFWWLFAAVHGIWTSLTPVMEVRSAT